MSWEDFVYMCMLFACIPFGHVVKICGSPAQKKLVTFLAGLFVIYMTIGFSGVPHSFVTILGTYVIIRLLGPRYGPQTAFLYVFSYLLFFRTCHWYGFPKIPPYANAVQLLVTLRMCTIAFEGFQLNSEEPRKSLLTKSDQSTEPASLKISLYDIFAYGYCYCGLLTGPYYRFTTYVDMLHQRNSNEIPTVKTAIERLTYLPAYAILYLPLNAYFPISHIGSPEYMNHPWGFLYQFGYLMPTFYWFRTRFYIGWTLAEASCITMCLGAYPVECKCRPGQGPTVEIDVDSESINKNVQYDFETIHNIKVAGIELTPNMRVTMKNWNMTIQWWLAAYVHRKLPFKKFRMPIVLLVSAFWHGVKPGYYLCFMSVPLIVVAEYRMEHIFQPSSSKKLQYIFDWINWFLLFRTFEYLSVSFMLLEIAPVLEIWWKLYFFMHVFIFVLIVSSFFLPRRRVADNLMYEKTKVDYTPNKSKTT